MSAEDRLGLIDNEVLSEDSDRQTSPRNNEEVVSECGGAYTIEGSGHGYSRRFFNDGGFLNDSHNFDVKHVWLGALIAVLATVTTVLFPSYINAANSHSDTYCALLFCSLISTILAGLAIFAFKLWDHSLQLKPQIAYRWLIPMGTLYGICGMTIFYSRDRNRVLCHLQDPLAAILLPATVVFSFFLPKVDRVCKLVCIAATIIGLFICVDFQIWDEFSCHGDVVTSSFDDGQGWQSNVHAFWTIFYVAGFALLAYFYVFIDKEIKILASDNSCASIPLEGICRNPDNDIDRPSTSDEISIPQTAFLVNYKRQSPRNTHLGNTLVLLFWVQLISTITVLLLFWTDFISVFGKAGSATNFRLYMKAGFNCYFGVQSDKVGHQCSIIALYSWTFIISYTFLFTALMYFMAIAEHCSVTYIVGLKVLSLPLSTIWWSFFQTGSKWQWAPVFSGETGFTVVGLPIMVAALVLYKYYADRERMQPSN